MRKTLYIVSILFTCLIITASMTVMFLQSETVQNGLVHVATRNLCTALNTKVSVGYVSYRWPAKLEVNDVYVEDQAGDTLAYLGRAYAHFSPKAILEQGFLFRMVEIDKVRAYAHKMPDGRYNYQWLIDAFSPKQDEEEKKDTTEHFEDFQIQLPKIRIHDICARYDEHELSVEDVYIDAPYIHTQLDSILFDMKIRNARYHDIIVHNLDAEITLKDSFMVGDLNVDSKQLKMTAQVEGTNLRDMRFCAEIEDACMNAREIQDLVSDIQHRPFVLTPEVHRLGEIHYHGLAEGSLTSAKLRGAFRTQMGVITTDAYVRADTALAWLDFEGRVGTRRFQLGRMLAQRDVGHITAAVETSFHLEMNEHPIGQVRGQVERFSYRGYTYHNLRVDADVQRNIARGKVHINDENIRLDIRGQVDWSDVLPELTAELDLHHFRPGELYLTRDYADLNVELHLNADVRGNNVDNINGAITIDSLYLHRSGLKDSLLFKQNRFELTSHDKHKRFLFTSDLFTAKLEGDFEYATLPSTFVKLAVDHVPGLFTYQHAKQIMSQPSCNKLEGYIYGRELQHLQYFWDLPIRIADYPVFKFYLDEERHKWAVQGYISGISTIDTWASNIVLDANNEDDAGHINLAADFSGGNYSLHTISRGDSIDLTLNATGDSALVGGYIHILSHITQDHDLPRIETHIDRSHIIFNDSVYHIAPSSICYTAHNTTIAIDHFRFGTRSQFVQADGIVSPRVTDTLRVELGQIQGGYILSYILPQETLIVNGSVSGHASLYGILSKPTFDAEVVLLNAGLNNHRLGDAYAKLYLSEDHSQLIIDADIRDSVVSIYAGEDSTLVAHIDGLVDLAGGEGVWGLDIHTYSIPLGFIGYWTDGFLTGFGGSVSGDVKVCGRHGGTWVLARALPHDVYITIPYTGCSYFINDSCFLDSTAIRFPNMTLLDEENNPLYLDGILRHSSFTDFKFDIRVKMDRALAIDLPDKPGELLQGRVYAGGEISVVGDDRVVRLDANARTSRDSRFRISIDGASSAGTNGFINFVDHHDIQAVRTGPDYSIRIKPKEMEHSSIPTKFLMALNVEANRNLLFQLVLNDKTGDMIQASGEGALHMSYDDRLDQFGLTGTYTLESGTLGFTLGGAFRRNFNIAAGSEIIFSGVPDKPQLNVTAKYRVTASLRDLFGNETQAISKARTSIPVDVCVTLAGTLDNPRINFALEFPSADDNIRQQVAAIINTEEMMMRQVVYLIAFGSFYTPEYMATTGSVTGVNEGFSILSSTITGQINSWLNKLTDRVSLGVNIRNEGGFNNTESTQEYEAQFQIQPVNRLLINGNLGYRYSQVSTQPFFGDLDVEVLLTENGKFRLKGFTHMVDKYSLKQNNASTIQGLGFVFKHDFNWHKDRKILPSDTTSHGKSDTLRITFDDMKRYQKKRKNRKL